MVCSAVLRHRRQKCSRLPSTGSGRSLGTVTAPSPAAFTAWQKWCRSLPVRHPNASEEKATIVVIYIHVLPNFENLCITTVLCYVVQRLLIIHCLMYCCIEASPSKRRRRSVSQPHLTLPKTPNLSTRTRSRPQHVKSQQQIDEEELQEHHKLVTSTVPNVTKQTVYNCF